jgi:tetratricopeptide (TPR) repeat protein
MKKTEENIANRKLLKREKAGVLFVFSIIILILFIICDYVFIIRKSKVIAPENNNNTSQTETTNKTGDTASTQSDSTSNSGNFDNKGESPAVVPTTPSATNSNSTDPYYYYDLGISDFSKNNYQNAIDDFNKAIELNNSNPNFYIKKSQVQVASKQKQAAIDTINQGLVAVPGNDSLLSQLDFITNVVK